MVKRLVLIGAAVAGLVFLRKKARQQQAEQDLWTQATDDVDASAAAPAPAAEPAKAEPVAEPAPTPAAPTATDEASTSS